MLWFYSALFYFNSQPKLTIKTQWFIKIIAALLQKKQKKKETEHVWQLMQSGSTQSQKAGAGTDETISPELRDNRYKEWSSKAHTSRNRWLQSHQKNFK